MLNGFRFSTFVLAVITLAGCVHGGSRGDIYKQDREKIDQELSGEISLKADRSALAEERKNIPAEKQEANDELALFLQLMKQGTENPQMVRDKFTVLVEKRRTKFREKVQKLRDDYHRDETKRRDDFLRDQTRAREDFQSGHHKSSETHDFFEDQSRTRQAFFEDERDRRNNFESEIRAQSKDFDSYMHEKMNDFNEQYRLYSKAYYDKPKEKKAVTGDGDPLKQIDQVPAKSLGTDD